MTDPRTKFEAALALFAQPGNRWGGASPLTFWAAVCGMTADEVIEAAHGVGVCSRDADIRRGMGTAAAKVAANAAKFGNRSSGGSVRRYVRTKPTAPKQPTDRVRRLIELGKDVATMEALRELSPAEIVPGTTETARRIQGETMLQLLFGRADWVHIRRDKTDNAPAKPGTNLRPMRDWLFSTGEFGEVVRVSPLTGGQGVTGEGKPSFACKETIAAFRFAVWEFDEMPLADQCRFWAGFIRNGKLPLVSLTYSGGKSIHGVVRVDAPDAETWTRYRAAIVERYAADPDPRYRLDVQALQPLTGTRLAGAVRGDTGEVQELLFDCGRWFETVTPPPERLLTPDERAIAERIAAAQGTPSYYPAAVRNDSPRFARRCAECQAMPDCKASFGRFWADRSSGGVGCNRPFSGRKQTDHNPTTTTTQKCFTL